MSHTLVNYPSDTNRLTKLVMPSGDLNSSAAALNASIKALSDAIAAAQAVLATLNSAATDPNITSDGLGDLVVAQQTGATGYVVLNDERSGGPGMQLSFQQASSDQWHVGNYENLFGFYSLPLGRGVLNFYTDTGNIVINGGDDGVHTLQVYGSALLDSGAITTDGLGTLCLHPQSTPPTAVAGGIYFDGTNFNFCADGATWVALTLP